MRNGSWIILIVLLISVILISGCTSSTENTDANQIAQAALILTPTPTPTQTGWVYDPKTGGYVDVAAPQVTIPLSAITAAPATVMVTPTDDPYAIEAQKTAQAIDYSNPIVKNFANTQVQHSSSGNYNTAQIGDVWQSIFNQWTYVSDPPTFDYFTPASDSITSGLKGNCEDYAILNAAVIESIGGSSRVVTACAPGGSPCHAYAEVALAKTQSDLQAAANYICSRYHCEKIYYHIESDNQGNTEYWLNLDWQANYPGGKFFDDDGTFQVFYPNGLHVTEKDTGYSNLEPNVVVPTPTAPLLYSPTTAPLLEISTTPSNPLASIYPITILNNVVNIPYNTNEGYYFNGNTGNSYQISVNAGLTPINILVMDQTNYNIYQNAFKSGSAVSFNAVTYKSVGSEDFDYTLPSSGTYYVVIDNSNFLTGSANSKTSAIVTTKILLIGNS